MLIGSLFPWLFLQNVVSLPPNHCSLKSMVIVDFALKKYPFIVATGVTLIVYFVVKRFADSLVTKMGAKSEFPQSTYPASQKVYWCPTRGPAPFGAHLHLGGKAWPDIPLYLLHSYGDRGSFLRPMVYTEQCHRGDYYLFLLPLQDRWQNTYLGQGMPYRSRDQGYQLLLYTADNRLWRAHFPT